MKIKQSNYKKHCSNYITITKSLKLVQNFPSLLSHRLELVFISVRTASKALSNSFFFSTRALVFLFRSETTGFTHSKRAINFLMASSLDRLLMKSILEAIADKVLSWALEKTHTWVSGTETKASPAPEASPEASPEVGFTLTQPEL